MWNHVMWAILLLLLLTLLLLLLQLVTVHSVKTYLTSLISCHRRRQTDVTVLSMTQVTTSSLSELVMICTCTLLHSRIISPRWKISYTQERCFCTFSSVSNWHCHPHWFIFICQSKRMLIVCIEKQVMVATARIAAASRDHSIIPFLQSSRSVTNRQDTHTETDRDRQTALRVTSVATVHCYHNILSPLFDWHIFVPNNGSHRFRLGGTETSCSIVLVKSTGLHSG